MGRNIGIDLGTTNSCISYVEGKEAIIIPNPEGARVIPSLTALNQEGQRIFGNVAKRQFITNSQNTIWGIKRLIGRKYQSDEVEKIRKTVGYEIIPAENGDCKVMLGDQSYSPEEISGFFLTNLREIAENYLGDSVADTVITVPAFFNDAQRQATKVAGEIAGLNVSRIINEPTAALLAYGSKISKDGLYAVFDLGGGTFDISIVEVSGDVYKVIGSLGDTFLGGSDFDARITQWIFDEVEKETQVSLRENKEVLQRVLQAAEKAKIELSFNQETMIAAPYLFHSKSGSPYHFQKKITRSQLENMTGDLVDRSVDLISKALQEINLTPQEIEKTILVGGQSRMPLVAQRLFTLFGKAPFVDLNPEEVVAQGAALQAEIMKGRVRDLLLLDVTPLSLGLETKNNTFTKIIERNSTIPMKKSMVFTTIVDNQTTVKIHVLQGERDLASENKSLGHFELVGIPLAPRGIPQIEVVFEVDANGIAKVSAIDRQTGKSQSMKVQPASGLSPEEIEKIISDAKQFAEKDKILLQLTQLRNHLKEEFDTVSFYYKTYSEKLSVDERKESDALMNKINSIIDGDDVEALEDHLEKMKDLRARINNMLLAEFDKSE